MNTHTCNVPRIPRFEYVAVDALVRGVTALVVSVVAVTVLIRFTAGLVSP